MSSRKLALSRETLNVMNGQDLAGVAGGGDVIVVPGSAICPTIAFRCSLSGGISCPGHRCYLPYE